MVSLVARSLATQAKSLVPSKSAAASEDCATSPAIDDGEKSAAVAPYNPVYPLPDESAITPPASTSPSLCHTNGRSASTSRSHGEPSGNSVCASTLNPSPAEISATASA